MSESKSFRFVRPSPYDLKECLSLLALGRHDPSFQQIEQRGWQTVRWVKGELCLITLGCGASTLGVRLDGPAAALEAVGEEHARGLLGLHDPVDWKLSPRDPMRPYQRAKSGLRLVRTFWLYEGAASVILCQRVSGREAVENWGRLCRRFGERHASGLVGLPSPERMLTLSLAELASCGIEARRATALKGAARRLGSAPPPNDLTGAEVERLLEGCPRIGPWTRALLRGQFWGDPDAVPLGDYGLPSLVCGALAGERKGDDQRMLELLEPYRGHRFRVIRHLWAASDAPSLRRGPRLPVGQGIGVRPAALVKLERPSR